MQAPGPIQASVLREPSPTARCTCRHWVHCDCSCHGRACDPSENHCDIAFLPDEGGLAAWGCAICTPGEGTPHYLGCELIGWSVTFGQGRVFGEDAGPAEDDSAARRIPRWPILAPAVEVEH
jgi:hypothetical protein